MVRFLCICLGGAFGTGIRYLTSQWTLRVIGPSFPIGTLAVNLAGAFLIELILHVALSVPSVSVTTRLALTTGVMGGLTTFSTFNHETLDFVRAGSFRLGALNVVLSVAGCFLAGLLGLATGRALVGP